MRKLAPPPKPPAHRSSRTSVDESLERPEPRDAELDIETVKGRGFGHEVAAARRAAAERSVEDEAEPVPDPPADPVAPQPLLGRYEPRWVAGAAVGFVVSSLATGALIWTMIGGRLPDPSPRVVVSPPAGSTTPPPAPISTPSPSAAPAPEHRTDDIRKLAALPPTQRTAAETVRVARVELASEVRELERLRDRLRSDPALGRDRATLKVLLTAARDDARALDALAVIAELPGPESADLLYELWTETAERTRTTAIAEQLVYSKDVLPKASPALRVALDLRRAKQCEDLAAIVPRATEVGDRRSLHLLGRLNKPRAGCGPHGKQDCHGCIRHTKPLTEAIHATLDRPAPRY
jgi:hypothetical protein